MSFRSRRLYTASMGYCTLCWPEKNIIGPRKTGTISSKQTKLISSSFRKTLAEIYRVMNSNKASSLGRRYWLCNGVWWVLLVSMLKLECVLTGVTYANLVADYLYLFLFGLFPSSDFCFSKVTHPPHIASDTKLVLTTHERLLSILNALAKFKPHSAWMCDVATILFPCSHTQQNATQQSALELAWINIYT